MSLRDERTQVRGGGLTLCIAAVLLAQSGCVSVDPAPHEQRAWAAIEQATGLVREDAAQSGLTIDETVRRALTAHPAIDAEFARIGVATADWVGSGLPANPLLNLTLFLPSGGGTPGIESGLAWSLLDLWRIPYRRAVAEAELQAVVLRVASLAAERAREVRAGYIAALAASDDAELRRAELTVASALCDQLAERRAAGRATRFEESVAESARLRAELALVGAEHAARSTRRALLEWTDLPLDDARPLATSLDALVGSAPVDQPALIGQAVANRLELLALRADQRAAQATSAAAPGAWLESTQVGVASQRPEHNAGADARDPSRHGPSLTLPLPLFDRGDAARAAAHYRLARVTGLLAAAERRVEREVRDAVDAATTAAAQLRFHQQRLLPQAEQRLELARDAWRAGIGPIVAVTDAEEQWIAARRGQLLARRTAAVARLDLERAIGQPLPAAP